MAITKNLVEAMGGTIDVESELGQGSCFEVLLDLKIAEDRTVALAAQEETDEQDGNILQGMKFLCAEDNELNAEILIELLKIEGAECTICENGEEVLKAFEHDITPIICCGETLTQRKQGIYVDWIRMQIKIAFQNVTADQAKKAVIAYEPIWAIGTGETATADQAEEVCAAIRACIGEIYDAATADAIRIQYGGSMNAKNAAELLAKPDIDGGLIGGASLKPDFGQIVNA